LNNGFPAGMIGEVAYAVGLRRHWFKQVPCVRKGNMEKQIEYVRTLLMKHAINRKFPQIIVGSLKLNFRQYGQMKSRAGKRQREEKD
jgi:hypothetical protein